MKTPINLIYDAFKNSSKNEFTEWIVENEQFLKEFERELIIHTVDDARGGDGELYWDNYTCQEADIFLKKPFLAAKNTIVITWQKAVKAVI